jgi:hypothetical protein
LVRHGIEIKKSKYIFETDENNSQLSTYGAKAFQEQSFLGNIRFSGEIYVLFLIGDPK